jgi:hypothetical protein
MEWIDTSCRSGSTRDHAQGTPTVEQLLAEMDRLHIDRALVMSVWSDTLAPDYANQQLFEDLLPHERLYPVPEVLPEGGEHFLDRQGDAIEFLVAQGAVAGVALCKKNGFPLTTWCAGKMLEAMQAARLPLMVLYGDVEPDHLHNLLSDFPHLPVILHDVPRVGYHRIAYPLLAKFPQLHMVCDPPHFVFQGIEYLVDRFGPEQLLWGTRFPVSEGGAAISGITYADISEAARTAIAGGNISRLMEEVRRG